MLLPRRPLWSSAPLVELRGSFPIFVPFFSFRLLCDEETLSRSVFFDRFFFLPLCSVSTEVTDILDWLRCFLIFLGFISSSETS